MVKFTLAYVRNMLSILCNVFMCFILYLVNVGSMDLMHVDVCDIMLMFMVFML